LKFQCQQLIQFGKQRSSLPIFDRPAQEALPAYMDSHQRGFTLSKNGKILIFDPNPVGKSYVHFKPDLSGGAWTVKLGDGDAYVLRPMHIGSPLALHSGDILVIGNRAVQPVGNESNNSLA